MKDVKESTIAVFEGLFGRYKVLECCRNAVWEMFELGLNTAKQGGIVMV